MVLYYWEKKPMFGHKKLMRSKEIHLQNRSLKVYEEECREVVLTKSKGMADVAEHLDR